MSNFDKKLCKKNKSYNQKLSDLKCIIKFVSRIFEPGKNLIIVHVSKNRIYQFNKYIQ